MKTNSENKLVRIENIKNEHLKKILKKIMPKTPKNKKLKN